MRSKKWKYFVLGTVLIIGVGLVGIGVGSLDDRELIPWYNPWLGIVLACLGVVMAVEAAYKIKKEWKEQEGGKKWQQY